METEIKIQAPEGMEIDKENSTFECIKFKPKKITYSDIRKKYNLSYNVPVSSQHYNKVTIFRKLLEVAEYLNGDWKPDWDNKEQHKYIIYYNHSNKQFEVDFYSYINMNPIAFSSEEKAKKAIEIIGEEELKKFFSNNTSYVL